VREVDVEQHDIRVELEDQRHGDGNAPRFADDLDTAAELAPHACAKELVVVDQHDADHASPRGNVSSTSVPLPGSDQIVAAPPARAIRASIDSLMPRRSPATVRGSKPTPRSRTKTAIVSGPASA